MSQVMEATQLRTIGTVTDMDRKPSSRPGMQRVMQITGTRSLEIPCHFGPSPGQSVRFYTACTAVLEHH